MGVVPLTNEGYLLEGSPGEEEDGEVGKDQILRGLVCQAQEFEHYLKTGS